MISFATAGVGFLLAVLWFDLMFDLQVLPHRVARHDLPEDVLASISSYYRRVTTAARPMNGLIGAAMLATIIAIGMQVIKDEGPDWVAWTSLVLVGSASALAVGHTFPSAVRLGARTDSVAVQSRLARSICRDHLLCLVAITSLLTIQLAFAG